MSRDPRGRAGCRRTGARNPRIVVPDANLAADMMVFKKLRGGKDWNGVLFVVDARDGQALGIDVVRERLVSDLRRWVSLNTPHVCATARGRTAEDGSYPG